MTIEPTLPPAVREAIARGDISLAFVVKHRNALIDHMTALISVTGVEGLRACAAGAAEATIIAFKRLGEG